MMSLGGLEAVVGSAGSNTLAITNAQQLAAMAGKGGGAGGHVIIEIQHSQSAEARIINSSIEGAEVRVTQNVQRHGALRTAIKKATT